MERSIHESKGKNSEKLSGQAHHDQAASQETEKVYNKEHPSNPDDSSAYIEDILNSQPNTPRPKRKLVIADSGYGGRF